VHIPAESTVAIFFWFKLNKTYDKERSVKLIPNSFKKYNKLISGGIYLISGRFFRFSVFVRITSLRKSKPRSLIKLMLNKNG
jgi:hypothetical protein